MPVVPDEKSIPAVSSAAATCACIWADSGTLARKACQGASPGRSSTCERGRNQMDSLIAGLGNAKLPSDEGSLHSSRGYSACHEHTGQGIQITCGVECPSALAGTRLRLRVALRRVGRPPPRRAHTAAAPGPPAGSRPAGRSRVHSRPHCPPGNLICGKHAAGSPRHAGSIIGE